MENRRHRRRAGKSQLVKCLRCWGTCCDPAGVDAAVPRNALLTKPRPARRRASAWRRAFAKCFLCKPRLPGAAKTPEWPSWRCVMAQRQTLNDFEMTFNRLSKKWRTVSLQRLSGLKAGTQGGQGRGSTDALRCEAQSVSQKVLRIS